MKPFRRAIQLTGIGVNLTPIFDWCVVTDPESKDIEVDDTFLAEESACWSKIIIKFYDKDLYNLFMLMFKHKISEESSMTKVPNMITVVRTYIFLYTLE